MLLVLYLYEGVGDERIEQCLESWRDTGITHYKFIGGSEAQRQLARHKLTEITKQKGEALTEPKELTRETGDVPGLARVDVPSYTLLQGRPTVVSGDSGGSGETSAIEVLYGETMCREDRIWGAKIMGARLCVNIAAWLKSLQEVPSLELAMAKFLNKDARGCERMLGQLEEKGDEEKWCVSYLRMRCAIERQDIQEAIRWGMEAIEARPIRLETLYHLTTLVRIRYPAFACLLLQAKISTKQEVPRDRLWIQPDVYSHLARYETSIVAFYAKEPGIGLQLTDDLLLEGGYGGLVDSLRRNLVFYLPVWLNDLSKVASTTTELHFAGKPKHSFLLNPSLCVTPDNQLLVNVRMQNHSPDWFVVVDGERIRASEAHPVFTINLRGYVNHVNNKLEILEESPNQQRPPSCQGIYRGFEDSRIFVHEDKVWFMATAQEFNVAHVSQMCLGNADKVVVLQGPDPCRFEKNWLAFSHSTSFHSTSQPTEPSDQQNPSQQNPSSQQSQQKLLAIYGYSPLHILELDPETGATQTYSQSYMLGIDTRHWRGSAGPILISSTYYFIVHEVLENRTYVHRIVAMDPTTLRLRALSRPFRMRGQHNVEYISGLALHDGLIHVAWGEGDAAALITTMPLEHFLSRLTIKL